MLKELKEELEKSADVERAKNLQRFFKTGKGEYGEGDIFLGIKVPVQRKLADKYSNLNLNEIQKLLDNKIHEYRLIGLIILTNRYKKASDEEKADIFNFYLKNTGNINNWDLVDLSAHKIVGDFLFDKDRKILYNLVRSKNLWERRISVISNFRFIDENEFEDALAISELLLDDEHDLIHKAVGWMLREIGKKDLEVLENFLKQHYKNMPRTMLRYAIEKLEEDKRKRYLKGEIE